MADSTFFISEVVFGDDGYVVVTNGGDAPADPAGLQLCQFPQYPDLPSGEVAPMGSVQVPASAMGGLNAGAGEAALYASPEYGNPDAVIGYVQWGEAGHKREEPAAQGGKWTAGDFVDATGAASMSAGQRALSVADWTTA